MPGAERPQPAVNRLSDSEAEELARAMAALTTPSRLKLLFGLIGVEKTVEELAAATGLTSPLLVSVDPSP